MRTNRSDCLLLGIGDKYDSGDEEMEPNSVAEEIEVLTVESKDPETIKSREFRDESSHTPIRKQTLPQEDQTMSSSSESDLEDLSTRNKDHRPYRDVTCNNNENSDVEDDVISNINQSVRPSIAEADIRKRVKKTVTKKQRALRRTKRGEAGLVTHSRREKRDTVKQSVGALDDW